MSISSVGAPPTSPASSATRTQAPPAKPNDHDADDGVGGAASSAPLPQGAGASVDKTA